MSDDDNHDVLVPLTSEQRIACAVAKLPILSADQVPPDETCPICLCPFSSILDGSVQNEGTRDFHDPLVAPNPIKLFGVTKLEGCGHLFCRLDLIEWICGRHGTCPACRHVFLDIRPISESDGESSDGDYIPDEDEDEDDDWDFEPASEWGVSDYEMEDSTAQERWIDEDGEMPDIGMSSGSRSSDSLEDSGVAVSFDGEAYVLDNARIFDEDEDTAARGSGISGPSTGVDSKS